MTQCLYNAQRHTRGQTEKCCWLGILELEHIKWYPLGWWWNDETMIYTPAEIKTNLVVTAIEKWVRVCRIRSNRRECQK